ncbi:PIN domain-containing protein [Thiorhodococcus minor]|uniref:Ribonuclease VapC n=1 Tax=Thiorhodococcus minor TaxID=57489 RepID=A0A6M0JUP0_9GAMM|nr:PIN domain-containing protein [Thiorhodococcus minor]NEV60641.1 PIN domain-containing protein [Thiorhodococcus minor]
MSTSRAFFDTNVLLYLLSEETSKADRAEAVLADGGTISVQVLNEFASVASRKLGLSWAEIREVLGTIRQLCSIEPLLLATHERGLAISERYGLSIYDALIVASALNAGCNLLLTEDLQNGQRIDETLEIRNPFASEDGR